MGWPGEIDSAVKDCPSERDGRSKPATTRSSPKRRTRAGRESQAAHRGFGIRHNALLGETRFTIKTFTMNFKALRPLLRCAGGLKADAILGFARARAGKALLESSRMIEKQGGKSMLTKGQERRCVPER